MDFWERLDNFLSSNEIVIDRPKGSVHPEHTAIVYPLDYGYLKNICGGDGKELDIWQGSMPDKRLVAVICTADTLKNDTEVKLLIGCTENEIDIVNRFHNSGEYMSGIVIRRDEV
jgi:inorganic pyrophosphatase